MRTSDSCRREVMGFTLLELLVVMTVVGLVAAMVGPNLQAMVGSVDRATRRDGLVADIGNLGYRAFVLGQSFELSEPGMNQILSDGSPVLGVPSGWRVRVPQPIRFGFNGICSGGRVELVSPDRVVERLQLRAPDCRPGRDE